MMKTKPTAPRTSAKTSGSPRARKKAPKKVSAKKVPPKKGHELLNQVISLSGIPADSIRRELNAILDKKNMAMEHLTLEQLRAVAATYLREIMGSLLDKSTPPKTPSH